MKQLLTACAILLLAMNANALPSYYTGEISGSGIYEDTLNSNSAWVNPPVFGLNSSNKDVSLWGYNANAGDELSLDVSSLGDFIGGISIYYGEVSSEDLLFGLFNNSGDFGLVDYIAGTSTFMADSSLSDIRLDLSGFYTIIVGGKSAFGWDDNYSYSMNVTAVPAPGALLLLLTGLLSMVVLRRKKSSH